MEPENIDWKNIESKFEEDDMYENIRAPKWVDLSAPDELVDDDNEAWFCNSSKTLFAFNSVWLLRK